MFKSRKKKQQKKLEEEHTPIETRVDIPKYTLLDDIQLSHDFRTSVILPQLNRDLDPKRFQEQLSTLRETESMSPPLSPSQKSIEVTATQQYQDLAAWRHLRNQSRYSNSLFGGKQRGRHKLTSNKYVDSDNDCMEVDEEDTNEDNSNTHTDNDTMDDPKQTTFITPSQSSILLEKHQSLIKLKEEPQLPEEPPIPEPTESYELDSDLEEDFFFKDFSAEGKPIHKKHGGRRRRSNKAMSRFNLSSFAKDLHDNRLSVIQPRESRIIMTEDDEMELEKLLERQRQRMSMMDNGSTDTFTALPPLPALDKFKTQQALHSKAVPNIIPVSPVPTNASSDIIDLDYLNRSSQSLITESLNEEIEKPHDKPVSQELIKSDIPTPQILQPAASVSASSIYTRAEPVRLARSSSMASARSHRQVPITTLKPIEDDNEVSESPTTTASTMVTVPDTSKEKKAGFRRSVSMSDMHNQWEKEDTFETAPALDWIADQEKIGSNGPIIHTTHLNRIADQEGQERAVPSLFKSKSLFGSLRQVSRSTSHNLGSIPSIKGLVRNLSSSHHHRPESNENGMSRAAMAVMQHNVAKKDHKKVNLTLSPDSAKVETSLSTPLPRSPRTRTDSNNASRISGSRLISQLISRASSRQRKNTKIVNMEGDVKKPDKRAEVVRRTIIYVKPDSLSDLIKQGEERKPPPIPPRLDHKNSYFSDITIEEDRVATKVTRQTSVRKRINDGLELSPTPSRSSERVSLSRQESRRLRQLGNVNENNLSPPHTDHKENADLMAGVELREMSDGSLIWGIVKKEGNRKSFYQPSGHNGYKYVDEEDFEHGPHTKSQSTPPPLPKRSPRRRISSDHMNHQYQPPKEDSTTDVYYTPDVTLPNLLKMMQGYEETKDDPYHPGDDGGPSVDDQLDEMMRILTDIKYT
ncbi:hypothetical protein BDB01DRAFT_849938 [Pilobolus umbonatus]|nr:hypothetical protein BDB01DRAFT_849938 [Pilobolus umbonatus]